MGTFATEQQIDHVVCVTGHSLSDGEHLLCVGAVEAGNFHKVLSAGDALLAAPPAARLPVAARGRKRGGHQHVLECSAFSVSN